MKILLVKPIEYRFWAASYGLYVLRCTPYIVQQFYFNHFKGKFRDTCKECYYENLQLISILFFNSVFCSFVLNWIFKWNRVSIQISCFEYSKHPNTQTHIQLSISAVNYICFIFFFFFFLFCQLPSILFNNFLTNFESFLPLSMVKSETVKRTREFQNCIVFFLVVCCLCMCVVWHKINRMKHNIKLLVTT